jgi:hypothetical protein
LLGQRPATRGGSWAPWRQPERPQGNHELPCRFVALQAPPRLSAIYYGTTPPTPAGCRGCPPALPRRLWRRTSSSRHSPPGRACPIWKISFRTNQTSLGSPPAVMTPRGWRMSCSEESNCGFDLTLRHNSYLGEPSPVELVPTSPTSITTPGPAWRRTRWPTADRDELLRPSHARC